MRVLSPSAEPDPHSAEYRLGELARYRERSLRAHPPRPLESEDDAADVEHALKSLSLPPGSTVLEFGSGRGGTAIALAMAGFKTISVDPDATRCELLRRKAALRQLDLVVVNAGFEYLAQLEQPVDAVLFFSSFHRAPDHQAVLGSLDGALCPGGKAVFACEPITAEFSAPWGLAPAGLEFGFQEHYFSEALARAGWVVRKHALTDKPASFEVKRRKVWSFKRPGSSRELRTQSATRTQSTMRVSARKPGFFLFGPFIALPPGSWTATIALSGARSAGTCTMDVCSGPNVFATRLVQLDRVPGGALVMPFELSAHTSMLEVRLCSNEPVELEIVQLEISPSFPPAR